MHAVHLCLVCVVCGCVDPVCGCVGRCVCFVYEREREWVRLLALYSYT